MATEYALYKGDELLSVGTIKELAEQFKVGERTIFFTCHQLIKSVLVIEKEDD